MLDIVVLAAGKGSRMKSSLPKVLHPVAGRPLLEHVLNTARHLNSGIINVVVGFGAEQVEAQLAAEDVRFIVQNPQLGTGHAVQQTVDYLRDDAVVLLLYGDVPLIQRSTLETLVTAVDQDSLALLTVEVANPVGYGRIIRDAKGRVTAIAEQKDAAPEQLSIREINTGVMAVNGRDLKHWLPQLGSDNAQQEFYLTDIITLAQGDGKVINTKQPKSEMEVLGVNNRQQQALLERYYQRQLADKLMQSGVTLIDPQRFDCRGTLAAGEDVIIDINCLFEGCVELGNNVSIGPNCAVKNAVIGDNTTIKANSVIEAVKIAKHCEIGPFARLRPGTQLADGVKIGNFVETKKADIASGSKVNHLSYVGDTKIGERVNIGAGTITCNYDGVNKYTTKIGDGAFIGSNTSLIAPVEIGKGATIGAGSVINKNVARKQLSIARGRQRNIDGWKKPEKKNK